jgi:hypothetical protein
MFPSRARKQAEMSLRRNALRDIGSNENLLGIRHHRCHVTGANEVETALEQSSPQASLTRNARGNW